MSKEECDHNSEPIITFIYIDGIKRTAMKCPDCGQIIDYYPQYNDTSYV